MQFDYDFTPMPTKDVLKNGMVGVHSTSMKCLPFLHNLNFKNNWGKKNLEK
jgi:hypothetical protein